MENHQKLTLISENTCFGGVHRRYKHYSQSTQCYMVFAVYLPPQAKRHNLPVLYWLSGVTCTDQNFMQKSGAQRVAAELGVILVAPDTSPRGERVPNDPDHIALGYGAGFYINATQSPWDQHYQMYDYVLDELPQLIAANFPVSDKASISGHSMGGHGALTIAIKNPHRFYSVSAFAPMVSPMSAPWGIDVLSHYIGTTENDKKVWAQYDTCALLEQRSDFVLPALIDQGDKDEFLGTQLHPEKLEATIDGRFKNIEFREQKGYDHGYYFVASFIEEHLRFHYRCFNV